jgi:hypothetical protein
MVSLPDTTFIALSGDTSNAKRSPGRRITDEKAIPPNRSDRHAIVVEGSKCDDKRQCKMAPHADRFPCPEF